MTKRTASSWLRRVRVLGYGWLVAVLACSLLVAVGVVIPDPDVERRIVVGAALALNGVALACWILQRPRRAMRLWRIVDVGLANIALCLVLLELVALAWSHWFPSPVVWDEQSTRSRLDSGRQPPGSRYFGFPLNSGGYHDQEFFVREEGDYVVAVLADSFGLGVVPYAFNFATLAEQGLAAVIGDRHRRVAIHNFGVPSIGMAEYAYLLEHEVRSYRPDLVVVCVFVGNDILYDSMQRLPRKYSTIQRWLFWQIGTRVIQVRAKDGGTPHLATIGRQPDGAEAVPAYVRDVNLEPATFTDEAFLDVELQRVEVTNTASARTQKRFGRFFEGLDHLRGIAGTDLLTVLIPDEFQVDDALYARLLARTEAPNDYQQDMPQQQIVAYCTQHGIACLDLTPLLRAHVQGGGERPYHLRDTHWNAVGNRIAGDALGRWLAEHAR